MANVEEIKELSGNNKGNLLEHRFAPIIIYLSAVICKVCYVIDQAIKRFAILTRYGHAMKSFIVYCSFRIRDFEDVYIL